MNYSESVEKLAAALPEDSTYEVRDFLYLSVWMVCNVKLFMRDTRGLQFYTFFGISIGITRRMIDIGKKITFYFCKMFENVQFFRICI
jgi:hypothetical protein